MITVSLVGCKKYTQVLSTKADGNIGQQNGYFVFENDTVKILYSFWNEKGLVNFSIYNKLDRPLYIDWKKSSYVDNSVKLNYWSDEEFTASLGATSSYFYNGPILPPGLAVGSSLSASVSARKKPERITFIPPESQYSRAQFHISPLKSFQMNVNTASYEMPRNDKPRKKTTVYSTSFNKNTSPLHFRNYLTFSLTENFDDEFYIDNGFYVVGLSEMDTRHFGTSSVGDGIPEGQYYAHPTYFYIHIPMEESIEYRKTKK